MRSRVGAWAGKRAASAMCDCGNSLSLTATSHGELKLCAGCCWDCRAISLARAEGLYILFAGQAISRCRPTAPTSSAVIILSNILTVRVHSPQVASGHTLARQQFHMSSRLLYSGSAHNLLKQQAAVFPSRSLADESTPWHDAWRHHGRRTMIVRPVSAKGCALMIRCSNADFPTAQAAGAPYLRFREESAHDVGCATRDCEFLCRPSCAVGVFRLAARESTTYRCVTTVFPWSYLPGAVISDPNPAGNSPVARRSRPPCSCATQTFSLH